MSLIGKSVGNYLVKAKLGEGGMGAVYLGEHPLIGKRVAIKVLLEELAQREDIVQRFFNEARAVNDIGHTNIVDIVDFGRMEDEAGRPIVYFVMEFLEGESLQSRLRSKGVTFEETLHIIRQCCSALAASHAKGIVHRDLKPDNIYLCPRGDDRNFVKVLDFGIAKLTGDSPGGSKTRTGSVIGTPSYMSPEQCEGRGHIDARSDIYSLGVVLYEMLTGRLPFVGEGFGEIIVAHLTQPVQKPSEINPQVVPELEALALHALEKPRESRFQSMKEFEAAVRDPATHLQTYQPVPGYSPAYGARNTAAHATIVGGQVTASGAAQRPTTLSGSAAEIPLPPSRGASAGLVGAAIGAAILLGGGGFFFWKRSATPPAGVEQPVAPPPPPPAPAKPERIAIKITSMPEGASVFRADKGDTPLGTTPYTFEVDKGSSAFYVDVKLAGYQPVTQPISTDMNKEIPLQLQKLPEEPAPTPVKASSASSSSSSHHKSSTKSGEKKPKVPHDEMGLMPLELK